MIDWKYRLLVQKAYFDKGFGLLNYIKYIIAVFAIGDAFIRRSYTLLISLGILYTIICYLLGRAWYKYGWILVENEVFNRFNLFQREVREHLNNRKI